MLEHAQGEALAARGGADGDLPDEQGVRPRRDEVPGDTAHHVTVLFRDDGGRREVVALKQVAVEGVLVERGALADQAVNSGAIVDCRDPEACGLPGPIDIFGCNGLVPNQICPE
jgi:hypothetical protein